MYIYHERGLKTSMMTTGEKGEKREKRKLQP
jgi:hypothetical protein